MKLPVERKTVSGNMSRIDNLMIIRWQDRGII